MGEETKRREKITNQDILDEIDPNKIYAKGLKRYVNYEEVESLAYEINIFIRYKVWYRQTKHLWQLSYYDSKGNAIFIKREVVRPKLNVYKKFRRD